MNKTLDAVSEWDKAGFEYGEVDCCQFADFVVHKLTGRHCIPWKYNSEFSAMKILAKYGGLQGAVTHAMGRNPVSIDELEESAVVEWVDDQIGWVNGLGIYCGFGLIAAIDPKGDLVALPKSCAIRGWNL